MSNRPSPYSNKCTFTVDIPWEIAEFLSDHGPAWIDALSLAVSTRRDDIAHQGRESTELRKKTELRTRAGRGLAIIANSELRSRLRQPGTNETPRLVLDEIAARYHLTYSELKRIIAAYYPAIKKRYVKQRNAKIIHLYFAGHSNVEIGVRLGISNRTVASVLQTESDLLDVIRQLSRQSRGLDSGLSQGDGS